MSTGYDKITRTDHGDGSVEDVPIARAYKAIDSCYDPSQPVKNLLHDGHPVRTTFATYQLVHGDGSPFVLEEDPDN